MRKLLLLGMAVAALLSSCIPVDDLGAYWDKGVIDTLLVGKWQPDEHFKKQPNAESVVIAKNGNSYRIDDPDEKMRQRKGYMPTYARTLQAGDTLFFMVGPKQGDLIRYEIKEDKLEVYSLKAHAMRTFLKEKHPQAKNIEIDECAVCRSRARDDDSYDDVKIKTLDSETFAILSEIPKTDAYWTLDNRYKKAL